MNTTTNAAAAPVNMVTVRRLEREWRQAVRAEEAATTTERAWKLAAVSDRIAKNLTLARAGMPIPAPRFIRSVRNLAKQGMQALAMLGRAIARAVTAKAGLDKARAVLAARKVRRPRFTAIRAFVGRIASFFKSTTVPTVTEAQPMFHTEDKGARWSTMAVSHRTLADARVEAARSSRANWCTTVVYDNTAGPVGIVVATFTKGNEV